MSPDEKRLVEELHKHMDAIEEIVREFRTKEYSSIASDVMVLVITLRMKVIEWLEH